VTIGPDNLDPPLAHVFNFETGLQGRTATMCPGVGSYLGVAPLSAYQILDPCQCELSGNIVEAHNDAQTHPAWQHETLFSPIIDRKADLGDPAYLGYNRVLAEWDQYMEQDPCSWAYYRAGWSYYGLVTQ
jgi:hypothetical protein